MTDDQYEQVRCLVRDQIMTITLTRPERLNAMTETMRAELISCLDRADADPGVRVVVITGDGRAFCAGTDLAAKGPAAHSGTRIPRNTSTAPECSPSASSKAPSP